jgi:hypothetical protein
MKRLLIGIYTSCFLQTLGICEEVKVPASLPTEIQNLKQELSEQDEAKSTWENLASYLRTEAKVWNTASYIGKDVLFQGLVVGQKENLLHIRNGGGVYEPGGIIDSFVDPLGDIKQYFASDTTYVEVFGSVINIDESHQIFIKAKKIVIVASQ